MSAPDEPAVVEYVILTDEHNRAIGETPKATVHSANTPSHRAFSCFLFNERGELLLQQRALSKHTWPGIWSNSACGHPAPHEALEDAVFRRLAHELGIERAAVQNFTVVLPAFHYYVERDGVVEYEFCPVVIGMLHGEPAANPTEVATTRWIAWEALLSRATALAPHLSAGIPHTPETYAAYRAGFPSAAAYAAAHTLPSGEPLSEWSLWEAVLLSKNETFMRARSAASQGTFK